MTWGGDPPKPMWARITEERDTPLTEDVATLRADMLAAQQAIMLSGKGLSRLRDSGMPASYF
jgi:hypothetical protein